MSESALTCQYTYTISEYKRALTQQRTATLYRGWWPCFILILIFLAQGMWGTVRSFAEANLNLADVISDWIPMLVFGPVVLVLIIPAGPVYWLASRRHLFLNEQMLYTFTLDEIRFDSPSVHSRIGWEKIRKVRETQKGFIALLGNHRSYIWWPVDGFDSDVQIEKFRQLLRIKVPDYRKT